jgi:CheY-like chemotaxis protein
MMQSQQQGRKVMIVDDHDDFRALVARLIRSWGHEVAVASDGPSALSLADAFQPECGILDVSMPGMNGLDLARRMRQRFPPAQLYLIALSGHEDAAVRGGCLEAGFDEYLLKPADIVLLERLLGGDRPDSSATSH